jgi:hypothetical protein
MIRRVFLGRMMAGALAAWMLRAELLGKRDDALEGAGIEDVACAGCEGHLEIPLRVRPVRIHGGVPDTSSQNYLTVPCPTCRPEAFVRQARVVPGGEWSPDNYRLALLKIPALSPTQGRYVRSLLTAQA